MAFNPMHHGIPVLKRLVPSLRKRLARLFWPRGFALMTSKRGLFLVNYQNFVDRQIAFYDDYEDRQIDYLLERIGTLGCDGFIDIGANIGFYSIAVARATGVPKIIAFEPDVRNLNQLAANLLLNELSGRIEVVAKAVSRSSGTVSFLPAEITTGLSRVGDGANAITIDAVALDDLFNFKGLKLFFKIDIEEHELDAVRGMTRLLSENQVFMQIECFAQNLDAVTEALAVCGLKPVHSIGEDHYFSNDAALQP